MDTLRRPAAPFTRQRRMLAGIITAAVLVLAAGNLASWAFLLRMRSVLEQGFDTRLELRGTVALQAINTDDAYAALNTGDQLAALLLERTLRTQAAADGIERILLVSPGGTVTAASDPDITGNPAADYVLAGPDIWQQAQSGSTATSPLYAIAGQRFKCALLPVRDRFESVIGILCVEADARFLATMSTFRNGLIAGSALSLAAVILFMAVLLRSGRSLLQLERKTAEQERLAAIGGMAARITHEIRNPLGIIKSTAQLIRKRYGRDGDETFTFIEDEVRRLNELITGFLGYARERELTMAPENLAALVSETTGSLQPEWQATGITLTGPPTSVPGTGAVPCDRDALRQVLLNLLLNARDAVSTPDGRVAVTLSATRKHAMIAITDNGKGISEDILPEIFTPFFSTKTNGSGLGLAVSKRLITQHYGTLTVSTSGTGSTFTITLPKDTKHA